MRANIEQRPRDVTLKPQSFENFLFHRVPVMRRFAGVFALRSIEALDA
jgi:hypothetical protein